MIDLFTKQEKIFIGFLLVGILVGAGIEFYRSRFQAVPRMSQSKEIEDFERLFQGKAILIDSLLAEGKLSTNIQTFSERPQLSAIIDSRGKSNQAIFKIDINHASTEELIKLPQIGRVIANRIIEYRSAYGEFKDIKDIMNIKGVGEKKFNAIKSYICIEEN